MYKKFKIFFMVVIFFVGLFFSFKLDAIPADFSVQRAPWSSYQDIKSYLEYLIKLSKSKGLVLPKGKPFPLDDPYFIASGKESVTILSVLHEKGIPKSLVYTFSAPDGDVITTCDISTHPFVSRWN